MAIEVTIEEAQAALVAEFALFREDRPTSVAYLMELGETMGNLTPEEKKKAHRVQGCLANVWLLFHHEDGRLFMQGDSDAMVTKGLVGLLVRILSGQRVEKIAEAVLFFPKEIGFERWLSGQRRGGFSQILSDIQSEAKKNL